MKTRLDQDRIGFLLSIWEGLIKYDALKQKTDTSKCSEQIFMELMNICTNDTYEDLNKKGSCGGIGKVNFPGLDVGIRNKFAYSVTSNNTNEKIYSDLETFKRFNYIEHFPLGIKFFILGTEKPNPNKVKTSKFSFFDKEKDILSFKDLSYQLNDLQAENPERFSKSINFLIEQFISNLPTLFNIPATREEEPLKGLTRFIECLENFKFQLAQFEKGTGIELINTLLINCIGDPHYKPHENFIIRITPIFNDFADFLDNFKKSNYSEQQLNSVKLHYEPVRDRAKLYVSKLELGGHDKREPHYTLIKILNRIHSFLFPGNFLM
jgi:hypothetical protein